MIFNTTDEQLVKDTVLKQQKEDLHYFRIINILFYIAVISIIISIILINIFHYEYDTPMYWVCFGTISIAAFPFIYCILYKIRTIPLRKSHKEWKKKIMEPDIIEVQSDVSIHINIGFRGPYEMKRIRSIQPTYPFYFLVELKGDLSYKGQIVDRSYTMMAVMKQQEILQELLEINLEMTRMEEYQNTVLKNVMAMDSERRNTLFIQELMDAQVFLAVYLHEDKKDNTPVFKASDHVSLAYEVQEEHICMYSDYQEISEQSKQRFPRGYLLPFSHVLSFIPKPDGPFFKEANIGIILNPNTQQITFTYEQLIKLQQIGGPFHGNDRN